MSVENDHGFHAITADGKKCSPPVADKDKENTEAASGSIVMTRGNGGSNNHTNTYVNPEKNTKKRNNRPFGSAAVAAVLILVIVILGIKMFDGQKEETDTPVPTAEVTTISISTPEPTSPLAPKPALKDVPAPTPKPEEPAFPDKIEYFDDYYAKTSYDDDGQVSIYSEHYIDGKKLKYQAEYSNPNGGLFCEIIIEPPQNGMQKSERREYHDNGELMRLWRGTDERIPNSQNWRTIREEQWIYDENGKELEHWIYISEYEGDSHLAEKTVCTYYDAHGEVIDEEIW